MYDSKKISLDITNKTKHLSPSSAPARIWREPSLRKGSPYRERASNTWGLVSSRLFLFGIPGVRKNTEGIIHLNSCSISWRLVNANLV